MAPDSAGLGPEVAAAIWLVLSLSIPSSPAVFTRCGKKVPGFVARETEGMCATATAYSKEHRHPPSLAMMVVAIPGLWNGRYTTIALYPPPPHFPIASVMDLRQLLASSRGAVACVAPVSGLRPSLHWFRPPSQSPRAAATLRLCGVTRTRVERREFPIPSVMDLRQLCSPMHRLSIWSLAFPSLVPLRAPLGRRFQDLSVLWMFSGLRRDSAGVRGHLSPPLRIVECLLSARCAVSRRHSWTHPQNIIWYITILANILILAHMLVRRAATREAFVRATPACAPRPSAHPITRSHWYHYLPALMHKRGPLCESRIFNLDGMFRINYTIASVAKANAGDYAQRARKRTS
ncbi:hypothetical protein C8R46DRAFT_1023639 [Mycena filopes]|nr:hypothetical protein C8R46DRAFT_1023639 [Mycena filopes]